MLHQYQREVKHIEHNGQELAYIEVTKDDINIANKLAHEVLGRTLDELPPQTRKLLHQVHNMVTDACKAGKVKQSDYRFTRKDVRNYSGWGNTQLKVHIKRLEEMEYLLVHRGSRGQSFVYELLYSGEGTDGQRFQQGLLNLNNGYDKKKSGINDEVSGASHTEVGSESVAGQIHQGQSQHDMASILPVNNEQREGKHNTAINGHNHETDTSYPHQKQSHSLVASL